VDCPAKLNHYAVISAIMDPLLSRVLESQPDFAVERFVRGYLSGKLYLCIEVSQQQNDSRSLLFDLRTDFSLI
jgi:hypothetical protein